MNVGAARPVFGLTEATMSEEAIREVIPMAQVEAPEGPIWLNNEENFYWQCGWEAGFLKAASPISVAPVTQVEAMIHRLTTEPEDLIDPVVDRMVDAAAMLRKLAGL